MSDVMCIVTNHEGNQAGLLFRVDSGRLFVMSDVIFIAVVRDLGSVARGTKTDWLGLASALSRAVVA